MKLSANSVVRAVLCLFLGSFAFLPESAWASRYHVLPSGSLTSGPSQAGDWAPSNCYPTLASATNSAAQGDSILLSQGSHFLDSSISLPQFLGNMDFSANWSGVFIILSFEAQMVVPFGVDSFLARGVAISSDGADSHLAAFLIEGGLTSTSQRIFESCYFYENQGSDFNSSGGSCIAALGSGDGASLEISNCLFTDNTSRGRGGAVFVGNGYEVSIHNSDFQNNDSIPGVSQGEGRGGAIAMVSPTVQSRLNITNTRFEGNRAWGPGGTIFVDDGSLSLIDSELNRSESGMELFTEWCAGAGILMRRTDGSHLEDVALTVENCHFEGSIGHFDTNPWAGDGGAILVKGINDRYVDVNVIDSVFQNNFNAQGSGLYVGRFATGNVTRCRFLDNIAYLQGGGSFKGGAFSANRGEAAIYSYCEFTGNRAGLDAEGNPSTELGRGGAFSTRLYPRGEFYNCTFNNNEAHGPFSDGDAIMLPSEGGVFSSDDQRCVFVNSVFYSDAGNSQQIVAHTGAIKQITNCAYFFGEVQTAGIDPDGTVLLTESPFPAAGHPFPLANSPLLDVALENGQTIDLLGNPVPYGDGPDIGAFERNGLVDVPTNQPALVFLSAFPNPFNPRTVLKYEMVSSGSVRLEIFDLAGHKIKTLIQEHQQAGSHSITWQGKDEQGQRMSSGVYFARLQVDGKSISSKLTLVQ